MDTWSLFLFLQGDCSPQATSSGVGLRVGFLRSLGAGKLDQSLQSSSLVPRSPNAGILQRVGTIILYFRGEELHIWHLILSVSLCIARICYMMEYALASKKISIDFFSKYGLQRGLPWGIHSEGGCSLLGKEYSKIGNAHGKCANISGSQ